MARAGCFPPARGRCPDSKRRSILPRATAISSPDIRGGGKPIGSVMVDTGGGGALMVSEANWAAAGLPPPPTTIKLLVLSGPRVARAAPLGPLVLGGATVRGVGTTILPGDAGLLDASHANGVIGANLLQRFHVVIDVAAGRM